MCNCSDTTTPANPSEPTSSGFTRATRMPDAPLSTSVVVETDLTPDPEGPNPGPGLPDPFPPRNPPVPPVIPTPELPTNPFPGPYQYPKFKLCFTDFREGCYAINYTPSIVAFNDFEGTLRVDRSAPNGGADNMIVSGDLYRKAPPVFQPDADGPVSDEDPAAPPRSRAAELSVVSELKRPLPWLRVPRIPIFPRARYHSYLKVTKISVPFAVLSTGSCGVTLTVEQFNYTQPAVGSFQGSFPTAPSRTLTMRLTQDPPSQWPLPFPFGPAGPVFRGQVTENGADRGTITLTWVSKFFRAATVEVDTLAGAVAPAPVPAAGGGTEFFDTIYAKHGWDLRVITDQADIPVPAGVTATNCWSSGALHNLMASNRNPATNLDKEWRIHLVVVPAKLGCGRGVMYDQIDVPREGCASFSDDGYPTSDSGNFGTAANKKQRDIPRAYLRSATHEITHTFNQIHQEQETTSDNSIMTTTPSVADVLGGPATGAPGVFPNEINLGVNTTVRHHLNHMPDPVIRPGGWPFASWFGGNVPQATDRMSFDQSELELTVACDDDHIALGQPVNLTWTMTNRSSVPLFAPNDVSTEGLFATITVTDGKGRQRPVPPFVIRCETVKLATLEPGDSVSATSRVFWSSAGFAFERPGRYDVTVTVSWSAQGLPVGLEGSTPVWVDYPTNDSDSNAAGLVMDPEVGKWVALGGDAYHLTTATDRLTALAATGDRRTLDAGGSRPRLLDGFDGLLPDSAKVEESGSGDRNTRSGRGSRKTPNSGPSTEKRRPGK